MIGRILTSNWFALFVLALAAFSLVLLYLKGRTREALAGAAVLLLAAMLIYRGIKSE